MLGTWMENQFNAAYHAHPLIPRGKLFNSMHGFLVGGRKPENFKEALEVTRRTCETSHSSGLNQGPWCCEEAPTEEIHYNTIISLHHIIFPDIIFQVFLWLLK